ncbi:polysaccharide lyase family 14 protein [Mycena pura]|uniref:Polysaccharide lyase family 14 protein n=1 Tax=Mycena pura TaxID=153505 RepID=A0AAD6VVL3_9AGAR|nr:polysaccharide lyase family 14 protein [Mycena pura]
MFLVALCLTSVASLVAADSQTPESLAANFGLSTRQVLPNSSTTLPFPSATQSSSDTQALLASSWSLSKGRIQNGDDDLSFVDDPFPNNPAPGSTASPGPVLQVTYPAGSFSGNTGGAQFYSLWNASQMPFQSMLLSYEVAFDEGYDWVKGGKLPGLRGGGPNGCSGGSPSDGIDCFSARLMWRTNGAGEAYTYTPTTNNICSDKNVICNSDDFGTSLSRGSFTFLSGQWNHVAILVQLNNPVDVANGNIEVYFNNVQALAQQDMQIRAASNLSINGLYFSCVFLFRRSDLSWATPNTTHTYFRNIQMWAGTSASSLTGNKVNSAMRKQPLFAVLLAGLFLGRVGLVML